MGKLRISVSGIRGKVPEGLNVVVAAEFASAYATYLEGGRIGVAVDGRWSGPMLAHAVVSALSSCGADVAFLGLCPTPVLQLLVNRGIFSGGISITGGHNPPDWNALLLLNSRGAYLDTFEGNEVFNIYHSKEFKKAVWSDLGRIEDFPAWKKLYLEELEKVVSREAVKEGKFKIVVDCSAGAASALVEEVCDRFGTDCILLNRDPTAGFPHPPEPSPETAQQAAVVVEAVGADAGFVFNSDASRVSFITEKGEALSEEMTLPLVALALLKKNPSPLVTTVATSRLADDVAARFSVPVIRTRVGQSAVVSAMEAAGALTGGEGSGSVCFMRFSPAYDSLLSMLVLLQLMAEEGRSLSELSRSFPSYQMRKIKVELPLEKLYRLMHHLEEVYSRERVDYTDGIRVEREKGWFNIRPSTTEFILRIIVEAEDSQALDSMVEEISELIWGQL